MSVARVAVDLGLNKLFDYSIPQHLASHLEIGCLVSIPFGHSEKTGFVVGLADHSEYRQLKPIHAIIGDKSLITPTVMKLASWMASYYCCPVETAVRSVLPSVVRRKKVQHKEVLHVKLLQMPSGKELEKLGRRAPRQAEILRILEAGLEQVPYTLAQLAEAAGTGVSTVRSLEKKGWVEVHSLVVRRRAHRFSKLLKTEPHKLMDEQMQALKTIIESMSSDNPSVLLLHGVTGSGKTEVYLQAISHALSKGCGAIVLVPEISLTPQTVERFHSRFGDRIAVLHSHLSDGERHDEWHRIRDGEAVIVVGARSALFAPVHRLGLIVVDEEHETSYKQEEAPRYHARDVAVMRGQMERCTVVLGSATPSMESYYNVLQKKYRRCTLSHRVDHRHMPLVRIVDMRVEAERAGKPHILSRELVEAIHDRIHRAEQTILFLNRRGYSSSLICPKCGYVAQCTDCSVSMTYHKQVSQLICHFCGAVQRVPERCPNPDCRDPAFKYTGMGTERIEEVIRKCFPKARVARMDSDTMTRKEAYAETLGAFRAGQIDILVGTQMIAKGLHFPNVTLVGVVFADMSLHLPDFRAGERTFQLITQVAGRAGRGDVTGEVIVQTYTPFHPAIQAARRLDYDGFCDQDMAFRKELNYPPYSHLVCITLKGHITEKIEFAGQKLAEHLTKQGGSYMQVASPVPSPIARIKGTYRYQLLMRSGAVMRMIRTVRETMNTFALPEGVTAVVDVDAVSLM